METLACAGNSPAQRASNTENISIMEPSINADHEIREFNQIIIAIHN